MTALRLGDRIVLESDAVAAPLAGYSDAGFRHVCALRGAGLTYTEMISAKGLVYGSGKTKELLYTTPQERYTAVQIFGSEPYFMQAAAEHEALEKFDVIDINMGCPVPKIVNNGEGSALLLDPRKAQAVVAATCKAGKPVTVKMRIGFDPAHEIDAAEFALRMQDAGACAITVHGRTRAQMYAGKADRQQIARVCRAVTIPVIANGDVTDVASYRAMLEETGAQGVMIGRGAIGNPRVFAAIRGDGARYSRYDDAMTHLRVLVQFHGERYVVATFRKHFVYYCRGLRDAGAAKLRAFGCQTLAQLADCIRETLEAEA